MAGDGRGWPGMAGDGQAGDGRGWPGVEVSDRRGVRPWRCPTVADQVPRVDVYDRLSPSTEPGALSNAGSCPSVGPIQDKIGRIQDTIGQVIPVSCPMQ